MKYQFYNNHKVKKHIIIAVSLLVVSGSILFTKCSKTPPLIRLSAGTNRNLIDSEDKKQLLAALKQHIAFLSGLPENTTFKIVNTSYPVSWMIKGCNHFIHLIENTPVELLSRKIQEDFDVYQAGGRKGLKRGKMLVTGYYEPILEGSLTRKPPFLYPLYSVPDDLIIKVHNGKKQIVRTTSSGEYLPYWSREEIEENSLLKGYELVFLKDPIDAFSLHVQGSGKILLQNGKLRSIRYAGSNGHDYNSIGKLLVDRGIMKREEVTMPKIRQYFADHPEQIKNILYHNKRYIFFSWAETNSPPAGSTGATLTPTRSVAIDPQALPAGAIAYLKTRYPTIKNGKVISWKPFNQFVLPQDSGSAIKGAGRVDVFWGNGRKAKAIAGAMKEEGRLFFLVKKGYVERENIE